MPETFTTANVTASTDIEGTPDIRNIGIELEYPVARDGRDGATASDGGTSGNLREETEGRSWSLENFDSDSEGYMGRDHTGAEITSGILDLHSDEPEQWYVDSINKAEELGYPFAATGYGDTVFGCHVHLSDVPLDKAERVYKMCQQDWARLFFCSSIGPHSLDPWRHGGVSGTGLNGERAFSRHRRDGGRVQHVMNHYHHDNSYDGHFEFRLLEPLHPDHFAMVMHFLRLLETEGVIEAEEYAYERVHDADERLTTVKHYQDLTEDVEGFPCDECLEDDNHTDESAAETTLAILQSNGY